MCCLGGRYTVEAEAGSDYTQNMWVTPAHHWIAFDVMACHEVYIALTWTAGSIDHNTREIALGVNNNRVYVIFSHSDLIIVLGNDIRLGIILLVKPISRLLSKMNFIG